jgi:hypothetical protein
MDYFQTNRKVLCSEGPREGDFEETKQLLRVVSKIEEEEIIERHSLDPDFSGDKDFNVLQYFLFEKRKHVFDNLVALVNDWQNTMRAEKDIQTRD